jgi:uncharacterized protein YcbK (DUF882 family)
MKYFTLKELTKTATGLPNTPDEEAIKNLEFLVEKILDPVRELWGAPITVNSGYRSPEVNRAVGGVATSQHLKGEAVDITAGSQPKNEILFGMIANGGYDFDQLIDEKKYTWIHVSIKRTGYNRKRAFHLN